MDNGFILFVDDIPRNAHLFKGTLRMHGFDYEVVTVSDGIEALDFLFGRGDYAGRDVSVLPRLILLDLNMPRMDGFETLRRIRADDRTQLLPVVIWSSSDHPQDKAEAYRLGANGYMAQISDVPYPEMVRRIALYWLEVNEQASPIQ